MRAVGWVPVVGREQKKFTCNIQYIFQHNHFSVTYTNPPTFFYFCNPSKKYDCSNAEKLQSVFFGGTFFQIRRQKIIAEWYIWLIWWMGKQILIKNTLDGATRQLIDDDANYLDVFFGCGYWRIPERGWYLMSISSFFKLRIYSIRS